VAVDGTIARTCGSQGWAAAPAAASVEDAAMVGSDYASPLPGGGSLLHVLARNWWAVALRGLFAVIFGVVALLLPGLTLVTLVLLFGIYMVADGVFAIVAGVRTARHGGRWWPFALEGVVDILAGLIALFWPGIALVALLYLIAAWAIVTGVLMLSAGFSAQRPAGHWLLVLDGVLSILLGIFVVLWPIVGAVALSWWIGIYALIFGVVLLVFAFRLRSHAGQGGAVPHHA
jgi:uncharacterized membrane protein HdeD (DUF308 family)